VRKVMSAEDLERVTKRIAHEIVERNHGIANVLIRDVEAGSLDIGMYRDDLDTRPRTRIGPTRMPENIDGKTVVVADDVLFTGRTIRAGLDALADLGRPGAVQLAVLIDRGHRQLPIRADFVGKNIPTAVSERVSVRFEEIDGEEGVWIDQGEGE